MSDLEDQLAAQIRLAGLPPPVRELPFAAPRRRFRFDFCWPAEKLAIEVDGGTWAGGRHVRGEGVESDCEKSCEAAALGWRLARVTGRMVRSGKALDAIERALRRTEGAK